MIRRAVLAAVLAVGAATGLAAQA
ncbi:MAG: hypothetical protein RI891_683, partial [Gemmatimonadota bacterium]